MQPDFSQYGAAETFLYELRNAGSKYSLSRISKFCSALGGPQNDFPKIHVAGTNGKGSVCAMLEAVLRKAGNRTGMFTSPHLKYLGERIQINRVPISKDALLSETSELRKTADKLFGDSPPEDYPSFFEFMTAMAFLEFSRAKVDCAVVEVGLGGRLDSTNIIIPELSVITSIGLDHIEMLGSTIPEIAREKAGIIKEGVPVVCGFLPEDALEVARQTAREKNAPFYAARDFFPDDSLLPETSLFGYYQKRNAATALLCARVLRERAEEGKAPKIFSNLSDSLVLEALRGVEWAARWQEVPIKSGGRLIVDASHNGEGALSLESNLRRLCSDGTRPIIAVGVLGEGRAIPILRVVREYAKKILLL
ncbi:MAG: bifunctional folylpolyglutamate synthase/dihydrofolate synthase, partial [Opitutales bacterium]|nr:bifunctional folylpolyglutamate synthase/dihydrofolate synthase [Opitutales bacterium]